MSSGEEEKGSSKGGGGETPGDSRSKDKDKGRRIDVKAYEESPPHDATAKEFRFSHWFIDENWRVIVEPPAGRRSGKTKAFVWPVDQKFSKKTMGKGEKRFESLVVSGFLMDAALYKKWDIQNLWTEHKGIKNGLSKVSKKIDDRKRKILTHDDEILDWLRCTKQAPWAGKRGNWWRKIKRKRQSIFERQEENQKKEVKIHRYESIC